MIITDTHTHLYSESFDEDRDFMIERAIQSGVKRFFLPAIDASYTASMLSLKKQYPNEVFLMSGLHPTHVKANFKEELVHVSEQLKTGAYVGVGEIGIDLYWDKSTLKIQQEAFREQIQLALNYELPFIIHCRDAFDEVFEILDEFKGLSVKGIFHCFTGTHEQALKALDYNMLLGIGGVITFKNGKIDQFLNQIPLEKIVLETDAPYLSPVPHRGKRNESGYITYVLKKVAELYDKSELEIANITTKNAAKIFNI